MLCPTGSCTELHAVRTISEITDCCTPEKMCLTATALFATNSTVSSNHLWLGGSDSPFNAALHLHAFCTQVQVNFRNGTSPTSSLSHFLLRREEILKPGQILLITPTLTHAEVERKKKEEICDGSCRNHTGGEGKRKGEAGGSLQCRKNVKLSFHWNFIDWPLFEVRPGISLNMGKRDGKLGIEDNFTFHCSIPAL